MQFFWWVEGGKRGAIFKRDVRGVFESDTASLKISGEIIIPAEQNPPGIL